jgi:hypothetical protein
MTVFVRSFRIRRPFARNVAIALFIALSLCRFGDQSVGAVSSGVVISQVYGGGGNSGATFKNDFIEIFNRGTTNVSLNGWSVQYASAAGTTWTPTNLSGSLAPGQYYLIQEAAGAGGSVNLPTPDATGNIAMSSSNAKVALVNSTTALSGACPTGASIIDLIGFGTGASQPSCFEASPAPTLTNTTAAIRRTNGCTETDNNGADFATGPPNPRNTSSPVASCGGSTNPSGSGTANPPSVGAGASTRLTVAVTPGTNPTSTGLTVTGNLSSIGGSTAQQFFDDGTHIFSFLAVVSASTSVGTKTIPTTIGDDQSRSGSASIALTVTPASTPPTGVGAADPSSLQEGNTTLLTVTVTPGSNPTSTGIGVVGNLNAIGGSLTQPFYNDGTHGDATAGDAIFSFQTTVANGTPPGAKSLPATITDAGARSSTAMIGLTVQPPPPPTTVKISQVYGGGGNSGSTYKNDFIEIYNQATTPIDVTFWSVQYTSAGATGTWQSTNLCPPTQICTLAPGHYYLVHEGTNGGGTTNLPDPDATGTIGLSATNGKVALVASTTALVGACPTGGSLVDLVGYGSANCSETAPTPTLDNTTAAVRRGNGCVDADNNAGDFVTIGPIPRNGAAPANSCGGDPALASGLGIALPSSLDPASNTLLTVRATPASAPPSATVAVAADLTSIGGPASQPFYDDGTHGDQAGGDNVFSFQATVGAFVSTGAKNVVATLTDAAGHTATAPITLTVISPTCGVERWSVKTGTDPDAALVNLANPVRTTILELGALPAPPDPPGPPLNARIAPTETTIYVLNATMTLYKKEGDVDYHIVLDDGAGNTLIAEIPSPACVGPSSPFAAAIADARAKFDGLLTATPFFQTASMPVQMKGVGFFDFIHGQTGVAPDGIELHPVLEINFTAATTTILESSINPSQFKQPGVITATVSNGGHSAPTGSVTFVEGGSTPLSVSVVDQNGQATFNTSALSVGSHSITVYYEGDSTSAQSTSVPLTQVVNKADQAIDFGSLAGKTFGDADFSVSATATSGLAVGFSIFSGPATIADSTVHITGAGTVTVRASQAGDGNYNAAPDVDQSFEVSKATATFSNLSAPVITDRETSITLSGTIRDGLLIPTGSIAITVNGVTQNPNIQANGDIWSSFVTTSLTPLHSPYAIVYSYGGDTNFSATSGNGSLTVLDTTPPVVSATPAPAIVWPPNKSMVPIAVAVSAIDAVDPAPRCAIVGVTGNDGASSADWEIIGPASVRLRADRTGQGSGRAYQITIRCADASGNAATAFATVRVPHDQGK